MMRRRLQRGFAWPAPWLVSILVASSCSGPASSVSTEAPTLPPTSRPQTVVLEEGVLYQDEFADPNSGWPIVDVDNYRFGYHPPDFYHVEVKAPNDTLSVFRGMDFGDVSVETTALVDHTDTETGGYRYGLALRRSGEQYYAFTVAPRAGVWTILKHSATGVEVLAEGTLGALQGVAPPGVTPDKLDALRVDAVGPNFAFTINGQDIARVSDADYATGDVGFFVETFDEPLAHIHYDSLVIRAPKAATAGEPVPTAVPATPAPTPASAPATLPLDPDVLVETVLNDVVEKANNAEVDAILSGDENDIELWWEGKALDRIVSSIRSIRSRFTQVTEVSWTRSGEWIRVLSNTDTQATYMASETWTFEGTIDQQCSDGSQMRRRYVESYPSQQYTLELRDGAYRIVEWQLGRSTTSDISTLCP